jgi:hypothetical protein
MAASEQEMDKSSTDGLKLFDDLIEHRITFDEFLEKLSELPKAEQDRLATKPNPPK